MATKEVACHFDCMRSDSKMSSCIFSALVAIAAARSVVQQGTYTNPVIPVGDTPDPGVAYDPVSGLWWAGTTGSQGNNCFLLHTSKDLVNWNDAGFIFTQSNYPQWIHDSCWAPELHFFNGTWHAYFVGRLKNGLLSVGVAVSTSSTPAGPWVDPLNAPLITDTGNTNAQGQIDPTLYFDSTTNTPYLIWKTDGNADNQPTPIRILKLNANGTAVVPGQVPGVSGVPTPSQAPILITNDQPWEGPITEAPWVVKYGGQFFLFYSGNGYWDYYAVGVARTAVGGTVSGPYSKLSSGPILHNATWTSNPPFQAPGHCSVVQAQDGTWVMVYHAWLGADRTQRHMMVDAITWVADGQGGHWPALANGNAEPGIGPQPVP